MELSDYLKVLRAHWLGTGLIIAVGVLLSAAWVAVQPKIYAADASAIVQAQLARTPAGTTEPAQINAGNVAVNQTMPTLIALAGSREVADRVIETLALDATAGELVDRVKVTSPLNAATLKVVATGLSPHEARDLAETWLTALRAEWNTINTGSADVSAPVFIHPFDNPHLPTHPASPNVPLALAVGTLLGVAGGFAFALVRTTLDRRIRSVETVEKATGMPVVGTLPFERSLANGGSRLVAATSNQASSGVEPGRFLLAESLRKLRTNIQFMNIDNPPRSIVVTSPYPGDGKSTIAANLALTLAASGRSVVLIDADLRRPMVASIFGLIPDAGLTDVLLNRAEVADVAQAVPGTAGLVVVAAGQIPPNPSEILGSERMRELLASLSEHATVVIDAPPVIPVTDAAVLANSADGALLVASLARTTEHALETALTNISRAGGQTLGVVLNRVPKRWIDERYYGYTSTATAAADLVAPVRNLHGATPPPPRLRA